MEPFVVSARKYRPSTFDAVVGQEAVTATLKNAIRNGHLAQAFLFTGPRGVGKTTCARILARTINCEDLREDLSTCGACAPCRTFLEGHSLNIFELDAASNNSVEDIRNLILQVQIAPQVGTKKVYIIDEVHMLSPSAFNAFLKTLEEPPSYAIFILATTEKHKILPTILSRCQVFDFRRIQVGDITRHLAGIARSEGIEAEPLALHVIAQKADGGLRDALSIFDQLVSFSGRRLTYQDVVRNLNVLDQEHYFRITDGVLRGDVPAVLLEFNAILQQGYDGHLFVTGLGRHFRDLLVAQEPSTLPLLEVSEDQVARYGEQARATGRELLVTGLDRIAQCDAQYKQSKEPRLLVELMLIQLCRAAVPADAPAVGPVVEAAAPQAKPAAMSAAGPQGTTTGTVRTVEAPAGASAAMPPQAPASTEKKKPEPALMGVPDLAAAPRASGYQPKRRIAGHVSIKEGVAVEPEPPPASMDADEEGAMPRSTREVNPALLLRAWLEYAAVQKQRGRDSLHATLMAREPSSPEPGLVRFPIVNEVQSGYLREERGALLAYLRRALNDPGLRLEVVTEEVTVKPRYTKQDRFNILCERNPALLRLKEELDLDLG